MHLYRRIIILSLVALVLLALTAWLTAEQIELWADGFGAPAFGAGLS